MADFVESATAAPSALRQGEILSEVVSFEVQVADYSKLREVKQVANIHHRYIIVMSQDCDLAQDHAARKPADGLNFLNLLSGILVLDAFLASEVRHRPNLNSSLWKQIKNNSHTRYQFLEQIPASADADGQGIEELTLDFKRYFTVEPHSLYAQIEANTCRRRCRLISPYLEHLTQRFYCYLARIGLPEDYQSTP